MAAPLAAQGVTISQTLPTTGASPQPVHVGRAVGTLDQVSPFASEVVPPIWGAGFNGTTSSMVWQTDIRAGMAGVLEGFEIEATGVVGAQINLRIRLGGGWNVTPPVWSGTITKSTPYTEIIWVDTSAAGILLNPGDLFVIEWQGNDTGFGMTGSFEPPPGAPAYPELIYLNGPGCYADCGWRIGFHTYMGPVGPTLTSTPLVAGAQALLTVAGATPYRPVGFASSLVGSGPTSVPLGPCGSVTLDLSAPVRILGILRADANGYAILTGTVPAGMTGRTIWLQALDLATCTPTNGLAEVVG
ncbi:MAG: hypothetical protein D6702_02045 [Planctomycetota bacterium]|nr:MAG: hypothetical protein D6702_02045 [Planctomycetota bacterium]